MFSSSSSECEYNEYYKYACGLNSNDCEGYLPESRLTPWYTTMGQPLVYYAQACPPNRCQRRKKSRKGPNCFVKAFKWYTQEHVPKQKVESPDVSNFATWLDAKYGEFLQNYPNCVSRLKIENISSIEVNTANPECTPCAPKRFSRLKSPWRKRKRATKEAGDLNNQTGPSFEIIMHPKDLTCPASDCCQPTPFRSKSTATLSSDTQYSRKLVANTHSLTCSKENIHSMNALLKGSKCKQMQQMKTSNPRVQMSFEEPKKEGFCDIQRPYDEHINESQEAACQCTEENMKCVDAQIQYEVLKPPKMYPGYGTDRETATYKQPYNRIQSRTGVKTGAMFQNQYLGPTRPNENDVSCQCSDENVPYQHDFWDKYKQVPNRNQSNTFVDKKHKRVKPEYRVQSETMRLDVSCQCSEMSSQKMVSRNQNQFEKCTHHVSMPIQKRVGSRQRRKVVLSDLSCECSDENIQNIDFPGQYQYEFGTCSDKTSHDMHAYKQETQRLSTGAKPKLSQIDNNGRCCASKTRVENEPRSYIAYVSEVAQTSDHSLDLEKETIRGYPLFMKIVRADKN